MSEVNLMLPWFPRRKHELSQDELAYYLAMLGPNVDYASHLALHLHARFKVEERGSAPTPPDGGA